jgi:hypothetical protein
MDNPVTSPIFEIPQELFDMVLGHLDRRDVSSLRLVSRRISEDSFAYFQKHCFDGVRTLHLSHPWTRWPWKPWDGYEILKDISKSHWAAALITAVGFQITVPYLGFVRHDGREVTIHKSIGRIIRRLPNCSSFHIYQCERFDLEDSDSEDVEEEEGANDGSVQYLMSPLMILKILCSLRVHTMSLFIEEQGYSTYTEGMGGRELTQNILLKGEYQTVFGKLEELTLQRSWGCRGAGITVSMTCYLSNSLHAAVPP